MGSAEFTFCGEFPPAKSNNMFSLHQLPEFFLKLRSSPVKWSADPKDFQQNVLLSKGHHDNKNRNRPKKQKPCTG